MKAAPKQQLVEVVAKAILDVWIRRPKRERLGSLSTRQAQAALDACHAEELAEALLANDKLIRDIRHRDARWHDDDLVKRLLDRNRDLLAKLAMKPLSRPIARLWTLDKEERGNWLCGSFPLPLKTNIQCVACDENHMQPTGKQNFRGDHEFKCIRCGSKRRLAPHLIPIVENGAQQL